MLRRGWRVVGYNEIVSEWRIRGICIDFACRERIAPGKAAPRILQSAWRKCVNDARRPGQCDVCSVEGCGQHLISHRVGTAKRHTAIAAWIPGEPDSWCHVPPMVCDSRRVANSGGAAIGAQKTRIARICKAERSIVEDGALRSRFVTLFAEIGNG